jgi:putative transcriptional regulator
MSKKQKRNSVDRIVEGLTELAEVLESGKPLNGRFNVKTVEIPDRPRVYSSNAVRSTRNLIGASQAVFASLMGASTALVQHWEQGIRKPSRMACRLLDEINRDPKRWRDMIRVRKSA